MTMKKMSLPGNFIHANAYAPIVAIVSWITVDGIVIRTLLRIDGVTPSRLSTWL